MKTYFCYSCSLYRGASSTHFEIQAENQELAEKAAREKMLQLETEGHMYPWPTGKNHQSVFSHFVKEVRKEKCKDERGDIKEVDVIFHNGKWVWPSGCYNL